MRSRDQGPEATAGIRCFFFFFSPPGTEATPATLGILIMRFSLKRSLIRNPAGEKHGSWVLRTPAGHRTAGGVRVRGGRGRAAEKTPADTPPVCGSQVAVFVRSPFRGGRALLRVAGRWRGCLMMSRVGKALPPLHHPLGPRLRRKSLSYPGGRQRRDGRGARGGGEGRRRLQREPGPL